MSIIDEILTQAKVVAKSTQEQKIEKEINDKQDKEDYQAKLRDLYEQIKCLHGGIAYPLFWYDTSGYECMPYQKESRTTIEVKYVKEKSGFYSCQEHIEINYYCWYWAWSVKYIYIYKSAYSSDFHVSIFQCIRSDGLVDATLQAVKDYIIFIFARDNFTPMSESNE